jgi:hypothetical protein
MNTFGFSDFLKPKSGFTIQKMMCHAVKARVKGYEFLPKIEDESKKSLH